MSGVAVQLPSQGEPAANENSRIVRRLLKLAWRYRWGCLQVLSLQLVLLFMGLFGLGLTGLGIDVIRHQVQPGARPPHWPWGLTPPAEWSAMQQLWLIGVGILAFALVRNFLNGWYTVALANLLQAKVVVQLRSQIYDKLQRLSFRFFDANSTGSLINRVAGDAQSVRLFIDGVIMQLIILAISLAVYLTYMVHIHVMLTLACLMATTPLIFVLTRRFSRVVKPAYRRERQLFDDVVMEVSENIQGVHVVKGFAREAERSARFAERNRRLTERKDWIFWRATTYPQAIGFCTQINLAILIAYGGYLVIQDQLPLGTGLIVFSGLLQQFAGQVQSLANVANSMQQSLIGAKRVFEVLDMPLEIQSAPEARTLGKARGEVEFRNVHFGYQNDFPVLRDVNFTARPGQCIAILGATGSGKTTLLSLIPRFYDAQGGQVLIDGVDVRDLDVDDLRRNIGIVFQESFIFSDTVAGNIAFGHPEAHRQQVENAARIAAAHRFIETLPEGYDTVLDEAGADLSGGQRQRLAIARALLLEPAILLLDDPTAAIDPRTEEEILSAMDSAMQGRTTFVIAHRLSTLKRADYILVLRRGQIVQAGTHEELIAQDGPYRLAAALQISDDTAPRANGNGKVVEATEEKA